MKEMLIGAGFEQISIAIKENAADIIKDWIPGSGAQKYVTSAYVTAVKPVGQPGIRDVAMDASRADSLVAKILASEKSCPPGGAVQAGA